MATITSTQPSPAKPPNSSSTIATDAGVAVIEMKRSSGQHLHLRNEPPAR